jgi:hypothetical protein
VRSGCCAVVTEQHKREAPDRVGQASEERTPPPTDTEWAGRLGKKPSCGASHQVGGE